MKFNHYDEAMGWLASIGGKVRGPTRKGDYDMVTVYLPGYGLERSGMLLCTLTGKAREDALRAAVLDACSEFHKAGAERLATGA